MDTIEHFSNFLLKLGTPNFLVIGVVIVALWLLISGLRKGLRRKRRDDSPGKSDGDE